MDSYINIKELIKNKEYEKALDILSKEYEKTKNSHYIIRIAEIYKIQNKEKLALETLLAAFKKSPDSKLAKQLGMAYFYKGKYKKAINYYKQVIDFEGINENNLYDLACSYHYDNNFIEAYKNYLNVLKLNNRNLQALNNLGCLYHETKNYQDAFDAFNNSINYQKRNPEAYYYLGILYRIFLNDLELSSLYLKKALFYDPNHLETYQELIKTYEQSDNKEEIEKIKKTISEKFPNLS